MSPSHDSRRRFLRAAGGLLIGASAPLQGADDDTAHRHRLHRQMPAAAAWAHFDTQLALTLTDLGPDEMLVLLHVGPMWFVQAACEGRRGLLVECGASDDVFDNSLAFPTSVIGHLSGLGWSLNELPPEGDRLPAAAFHFAFPVATDAAAQLVVRTLRDAFGTPHPSALRYRAFTANHREVRFPGLRLLRRS